MKQIQKILICTTARKSNGVMGSGFKSFDTKQLKIVAEVDKLIEAENIEGIENYICIPVIRFEK